MLDEIGFEPVGRLQRLVAVAQRAFDAETVGDVGEVASIAPSGKGDSPSDRMVRSLRSTSPSALAAPPSETMA